MNPRTVAAALLVVAAAVWARVNGPFEGRVLLVFTPDHGFTEADLLSVAAVALAVLLLLAGRLTRRARARGDDGTQTDNNRLIS